MRPRCDVVALVCAGHVILNCTLALRALCVTPGAVDAAVGVTRAPLPPPEHAATASVKSPATPNAATRDPLLDNNEKSTPKPTL